MDIATSPWVRPRQAVWRPYAVDGLAGRAMTRTNTPRIRSFTPTLSFLLLLLPLVLRAELSSPTIHHTAPPLSSTHAAAPLSPPTCQLLHRIPLYLPTQPQGQASHGEGVFIVFVLAGLTASVAAFTARSSPLGAHAHFSSFLVFGFG